MSRADLFLGFALGALTGIAGAVALNVVWTGGAGWPGIVCGAGTDGATCVREWGIALGTLSAALVGLGSLFQLRREHIERRQRDWDESEAPYLAKMGKAVHNLDLSNRAILDFEPVRDKKNLTKSYISHLKRRYIALCIAITEVQYTSKTYLNYEVVTEINNSATSIMNSADFYFDIDNDVDSYDSEHYQQCIVAFIGLAARQTDIMKKLLSYYASRRPR